MDDFQQRIDRRYRHVPDVVVSEIAEIRVEPGEETDDSAGYEAAGDGLARWASGDSKRDKQRKRKIRQHYGPDYRNVAKDTRSRTAIGRIEIRSRNIEDGLADHIQHDSANDCSYGNAFDIHVLLLLKY